LPKGWLPLFDMFICNDMAKEEAVAEEGKNACGNMP
jgi:hypothetical protein